MKIAHLEFPDRPVFLAPMEDVTDIGFRLLCKRFGADMVYTEFISSDALIRDIKKTKAKILFGEEERPIGIQIYGSDPDAMVEAAKICEEADPDLIDINFGCPVKKIAGRGAGSGMMRSITRSGTGWMGAFTRSVPCCLGLKRLWWRKAVRRFARRHSAASRSGLQAAIVLAPRPAGGGRPATRCGPARRRR